MKPSVLTRIFDIIERLLAYAVDSEELSSTLIRPYIEKLLENFAILVQRSSSSSGAADNLVQREISHPNRAISVCYGWQTSSGLFVPPCAATAQVEQTDSEKMKVNILEIVTNLLPSLPELHEKDATLYTKIFDTLSLLLQQLRGRSARLALISAFDELARLNGSLLPLTSTISSLNAFSQNAWTSLISIRGWLRSAT